MGIPNCFTGIYIITDTMVPMPDGNSEIGASVYSVRAQHVKYCSSVGN